MQFYEARLLTNVTVVNDAIKFVSDYSNNNKKLSLRRGAEICGCIPFSEYLKYPLLGILVLNRRALADVRTSGSVLHWHVPLLPMCFILSSFLVLSNNGHL